MKNKITYLLFFTLLSVGFSFRAQITQPKTQVKLLNTNKEFTAGDLIQLKFSSDSEIHSSMYVTNSYGSILLQPSIDDGFIIYTIPQSISKKSGLINWKLLVPFQNLSGSFYINPKATGNKLESYLGPPSIQAGGRDFSMLVVIPTDELDNPLEDNTVITIKSQFLDSEDSNEVLTKNLIAFKNIYSPKASGRILIGSECKGETSKEFDINVLASNPTDFSISEYRNHNYGDGNQIVTLKTSQINDEYGNVVEDGTFVEFFITNKNGSILKASGTTIEGMATAKIIHPDRAEQWKVKAYVTGMAESEVINFNFEQLFDDFEVSFSENNRTITVGPLKSFMQQLIPDGFNVELSVYKNQEYIKTLSKQSVSGKVIFKLNPDVFPEDNYTLKINTGGIERSFNLIQL